MQKKSTRDFVLENIYGKNEGSVIKCTKNLNSVVRLLKFKFRFLRLHRGRLNPTDVVGNVDVNSRNVRCAASW